MKKILLLLVALFIGYTVNAEETVEALRGVEIVRQLNYLNLEDERSYYDVTITLKSNNPLSIFMDDNVKVTVKDSEGKVIYKKKFKGCCLFVFSNGEIHVGVQNFDRIIIRRIEDSWAGKIKEKEGIY